MGHHSERLRPRPRPALVEHARGPRQHGVRGRLVRAARWPAVRALLVRSAALATGSPPHPRAHRAAARSHHGCSASGAAQRAGTSGSCARPADLGHLRQRRVSGFSGQPHHELVRRTAVQPHPRHVRRHRPRGGHATAGGTRRSHLLGPAPAGVLGTRARRHRQRLERHRRHQRVQHRRHRSRGTWRHGAAGRAERRVRFRRGRFVGGRVLVLPHGRHLFGRHRRQG